MTDYATDFITNGLLPWLRNFRDAAAKGNRPIDGPREVAFGATVEFILANKDKWQAATEAATQGDVGVES